MLQPKIWLLLHVLNVTCICEICEIITQCYEKDTQEGKFTVSFTSTDKSGIKTIHFVQFSHTHKKGPDIQDFSTVKYRGRNNAFFQRTVKVGIKVIIKLIKMTKKRNYIHLHTDNIFLLSESLASALLCGAWDATFTVTVYHTDQFLLSQRAFFRNTGKKLPSASLKTWPTMISGSKCRWVGGQLRPPQCHHRQHPR